LITRRVALILVCLVSALPATASAQQGETVIFAVSKYGEDAILEPVVILRRGAYAHPPSDDSGISSRGVEADTKAFIRDYFKAGRQYRLLFGGGEAGSAAVIKYNEPGCVQLNASASVQTQARVGGGVKALATNSQTLGRGQGSRRAPTDAERASALTLAREAFTRNRVPAALVSTMEVNNLTALDLDRDGAAELVGSFTAGKVEPDGSGNQHTLFVIYEQRAGKLASSLVWSNSGTEESYASRRLVDVLDVDGDGTAEIFAEGTYYESNDYFIYKKQRGRWTEVYKGGGGGC